MLPISPSLDAYPSHPNPIPPAEMGLEEKAGLSGLGIEG